MNFFSPKKKKPDPAKSQLNRLIEATCNGWTTAVINIAESGIDLNTKTETGITALHIAAQLGNNTIVKALIKFGADVNSRESNYLSTPLHFAAMKSKVITMQDLIKIKNAIADRGCHLNSEVMLPEDMKYSIESYEAVIVTLSRKGADLNARDSLGKTPLHLAIHYRSNSVKTLLGLGADVDAEDNEGRLPWHYAVQHDNYEGLRWLLAFGADINNFNMFREGELDDVKFMFTYSKSSMKYLMYDQITRLRAANLFISRVYPVYDGSTSSQNYYNKCADEVKKMENYEIEDGVSLYDLLHMSPKRKAAYTKPSDKIKDMLIEFESQFPNYYGIIRANFFADHKRKAMLKEATSAWYTLTKISLPDICVEHILSYLDGCYLNIMIDGAKYCQDLK